MRQGIRANAPALAISLIALFVALGGTVYAAKKARINGRAIAVKSLPGNRLKPHSVPADRLAPGVIPEAGGGSPQPGGELTGADINELTLGEVPTAAHADSADTARHAAEADTAVNAENAINAVTVNGHGVGCSTGMLPFAGACWEPSARAAATAPEAAADCAAAGGALPEALQLAAFAKQPDVTLDPGDEWGSDVTSVSGPNLYSVSTVSSAGEINYLLSSSKRRYRCVIPLVA